MEFGYLKKNAIQVNSKMETNIPGVYAAGDVSTYDGKVKLIATGFGEAPTAVNNAKVYIDLKHVYSQVTLQAYFRQKKRWFL